MHTVFINTTKNQLGGRFDSLQTAKDMKTLMYVECPLELWNDKEQGYASVADRIAEYIDTYNYVSNEYNLIVYVDMLQAYELMKVDFFGTDEVQRYYLAQLCNQALARMVASTLVTRLKNDGREPVEIPVMLLERPKINEPSSGAEHREEKMQMLRQLLHLAKPEQIMEKLYGNASGQINDIRDEIVRDAKLDLCDFYEEKMQILVKDLQEKECAADAACEELYHNIESLFATDLASNLTISEYYTNKRTNKLSLAHATRHNFLLQSFVLSCVNDATAYCAASGKVKQIPELDEKQWNEILTALGQKNVAYAKAKQEIANMLVDFSGSGLTPTLYALAREDFGLNESGNISHTYETQTVVQEDDKKNKKKDPKDTEQQPTKKSMKKQQTVLVEKRGEIKRWLDDTVYSFYDATGGVASGDLENVAPSQYNSRATQLAEHHQNIFNNLAVHIKRHMSHYSSRSVSNAPAILRKRHVNMGEMVSEDQKNDYKYAKKNGTSWVVDTDSAETVVQTSKTAYVNIMLEYLRFEAGRGVAMRSIKEAGEKFLNKLNELQESLKKLAWVLILLAVSITAVYFPFLLIQWENFTKNVDTLLVGLVSFLVPYILLLVFYGVAKAAQKKKIKDAWDDFLIVSKAASMENQNAITAYDDMMVRYIPALRWIYEYVLDVDFYYECCDIALAKLAHHRDKLDKRYEALGNFLEDLDYTEWERENASAITVEYAKAFCEGDANRDFYSIIDKKMLDKLYNKE